jgi:hypothetical protein
MHGLTVRWSLVGASADVLDRLRDYVADTSFERFSAREGLRFKTWRAVPGEWFEGCYVFVDDAARERFQAEFEPKADGSPVSGIVGHGPERIEPCQVLAVAEGPDGFLAAPRY